MFELFLEGFDSPEELFFDTAFCTVQILSDLLDAELLVVTEDENHSLSGRNSPEHGIGLRPDFFVAVMTLGIPVIVVFRHILDVHILRGEFPAPLGFSDVIDTAVDSDAVEPG